MCSKGANIARMGAGLYCVTAKEFLCHCQYSLSRKHAGTNVAFMHRGCLREIILTSWTGPYSEPDRSLAGILDIGSSDSVVLGAIPTFVSAERIVMLLSVGICFA